MVRSRLRGFSPKCSHALILFIIQILTSIVVRITNLESFSLLALENIVNLKSKSAEIQPTKVYPIFSLYAQKMFEAFILSIRKPYT